jgi:hypothetical protein
MDSKQKGQRPAEAGRIFLQDLFLALATLLAALTGFLGLLTGLVLLPLLATLSRLITLLVLLILIVLIGHRVSFSWLEEQN